MHTCVHTCAYTHTPLIDLYTHILFLRSYYMLGALYKWSAILDSSFPESRAWGKELTTDNLFWGTNLGQQKWRKSREAREDVKQCKVTALTSAL